MAGPRICQIEMKLLDLLEQYPGWTFDSGGRMWESGAYIREYEATARPGDRGPQVQAEPSVDRGAVTVTEADSSGAHGATIGLLYQQGRRR
jgi:hypothetical protein